MEKLVVPLTERAGLTVPEAAALLGVSNKAVYDLVHREGFPVVRVGRKFLIPRLALLSWLEVQAGGVAV